MAGKRPAPSPVTTGEFAQRLSESGLFDAGDLLLDDAAADGAAAAQKLVETGKLTGFQADALLGDRAGDLVIGNYEILDRLGAGGMGTVYKARHRRMKRVVALKVMSKDVAMTERFASRFQREVETIARLTHPNVVMAYDADESESGPFLVMEFVNGRDLTSVVEKSGPLSVLDAVDCIVQAARGLEYAHAQGIVHRDIKPGNLMRDADGVVKVADLGLARLTTPSGSGGQASLTQAGMVVGTAEYMAPEQAVDSGTVDHRVDVYSLGCTLYFLLTGEPPYRGSSLMAVLLKHRDEPIPSLRGRRPDVSPELEAVFRRMVAKKPDDRYPSMTEVASDLLRVPTTAQPPVLTTPAAPAGMQDRTMAHDPLTPPESGRFEVSPALAAPPPSQAGALAGLTVVVVEPSRTQAGIISRYLGQLDAGGIHVTASGREGLATAKRERAAVVLCSMHLSDMTGVDLARAVLADPACARLGVVVATSGADAEHLTGLPSDPRVVVLPKPFDPQQLARSITSAVG
jgi:serine/threonine-protein kinase